ncbi:MAG: type II toxin-antitoxin system RelE/ParE family toxin [Holophaga sp.]|nr:type II toxin-antitoxin system RelE/ParE family toxin [Holophaga sp.]
MNEVRRTPEFDQWLDGMKDKTGQHKIQVRILRLGLGLMGDVKPVREGVSELRIDSGPGYRVYFTKQGKTLIFLLAGGDKSTQEKDIRNAIELVRNL